MKKDVAICWMQKFETPIVRTLEFTFKSNMSGCGTIRHFKKLKIKKKKNLLLIPVLVIELLYYSCIINLNPFTQIKCL